MNWYSSGFGGVEESVATRKAEWERIKKQPRRVMLKVGEEARFIFLDDVAFTYDEHKIIPPGPDGWKNATMRTCIGAQRGCPDCKDGNRSNRMVAFSVIDRRSWIDRDGKKHENEKRLLALRDDVALELKKKMLVWGGLKGREVIISRVGDRSPNSGNAFDVLRGPDHAPVVRDLEAARAKGLDVEPYDYLDILAPVYKSGNSARSVSVPAVDLNSDNPFADADGKAQVEDDIAF